MTVMEAKRKAGNLFLRAGVEEDEFRRIFPEVMENNRSSLVTFSTVAVVFSALMLAYMLLTGVNEDFIPVYLFMFAATLAISVLAARCEKAKGVFGIVLMYCFLCVLLFFGMKLGLHNPIEISATFIALQLTVPALFSDRPVRMYGLIAFGMIVFIFVDRKITAEYAAGLTEATENAELYLSIAESTLRNNTINVIVFGLISMITCTYTMMIKMKRYSLEGTIRRMAETDQLTGLQNRASYQLRLDRMAVLCEHSFFCIYADVNGLHEINNTQGHEAGDRMLRYIATAFGNVFGSENVYRIGGDEFVVLGVNIEEEKVKQMLAGVRTAIEGANYHVATGMTYRERTETNVETMIKQAETYMYEDKKAYYAANGGRKAR